jgi:hypothetical protein
MKTDEDVWATVYRCFGILFQHDTVSGQFFVVQKVLVPASWHEEEGSGIESASWQQEAAIENVALGDVLLSVNSTPLSRAAGPFVCPVACLQPIPTDPSSLQVSDKKD